MNERYLFRAKRINNGEWVEGGSIITFLDGGVKSYYMPAYAEKCTCIHDENDNITSFENCIFYRVDPSTICQCTGLSDKNGKLVFENDIMSAHLDDSFPEDITYTRVMCGDTGYCLKEKGSIGINPMEIIDMEYFAVCGNIFDNPELLEQEG